MQTISQTQSDDNSSHGLLVQVSEKGGAIKDQF